MAVTCNDKYVRGFLSNEELNLVAPDIAAAHQTVLNRNGLGNEFLGWVDLPMAYDQDEFARIQKAAAKIKADTEVLVVIGIGGSYLGARAAIELLRSPFYNNLKKDTPNIYFVGNNINPHYLNEILSLCEGKEVSVNVISKSGTTTEPALAFRVFRSLLEQKYGKDGARSRIYCTTDKARGTLKQLADEQGYESFVIPDDVGGRYSVLTAVGLLPIAVSGVDISALMAGAAAARETLLADASLENPACRYAALRTCFYRRGKSVELLASYEPAFTMMAEWYKQLFGESEGKNNKGLFPASVTFSTDLHSMGQYIQDGERILFETVVDFGQPKSDFFLQPDPANADGLNFLAGQDMSIVNRRALQGTLLAHTEGGVPNILLEIPSINEHEVGWFIYFMEFTCALSGYALGVNPFDQPGVESYKKNMFALLGKPGYEERKVELEAKLQA